MQVATFCILGRGDALATYAAARAEALISSSFLIASFVQSLAFRSRNLRSCSSWVRAAYHSHWRTSSKHSAMVDMVFSDHDPALSPYLLDNPDGLPRVG